MYDIPNSASIFHIIESIVFVADLHSGQRIALDGRQSGEFCDTREAAPSSLFQVPLLLSLLFFIYFIFSLLEN